MSVLLIKTDPIYFYLNNDTKDYPQQNKFVIVDMIQNEWHKLVFINTSLYFWFKHQILYWITCIVSNLVKFHSKFYLYQFNDACENHLKKQFYKYY